MNVKDSLDMSGGKPKRIKRNISDEKSLRIVSLDTLNHRMNGGIRNQAFVDKVNEECDIQPPYKKKGLISYLKRYYEKYGMPHNDDFGVEPVGTKSTFSSGSKRKGGSKGHQSQGPRQVGTQLMSCGCFDGCCNCGLQMDTEQGPRQTNTVTCRSMLDETNERELVVPTCKRRRFDVEEQSDKTTAEELELMRINVEELDRKTTLEMKQCTQVRNLITNGFFLYELYSVIVVSMR
jgi:hypothetical protein